MPEGRITLKRVELGPHHHPKGNVHYFMEGRPMPKPHALRIEKPPAGAVCYMVYLDRWDAAMTETWHPSPDAAVYHAKWEYGIEPDEWSDGAPMPSAE
jgi:hypothetical protein